MSQIMSTGRLYRPQNAVFRATANRKMQVSLGQTQAGRMRVGFLLPNDNRFLSGSPDV